MPMMNAMNPETRSWRGLRILLGFTLVLVTLQGSTGGYIAGSGNFPTAVGGSASVVASALAAGPPVVTWHGFEGALIVLLALAVTAFSFRYPKRSVRTCAVLSLVAAIVAATGGYLIVSAGSPAGDALMGNGFIGTYAFLFLTLYFTK
jgi:hypothetical protein